jgi:hypothetical protein
VEKVGQPVKSASPAANSTFLRAQHSFSYVELHITEGAITLAILLGNGFADWRHASLLIKSCLWLTWTIMTAVLVALYIMHPMLDRMLDIEAHRIVDRSRFHGLHAVYMNLSTVQWVAGLLHLWLTLFIWRAGPTPDTNHH